MVRSKDELRCNLIDTIKVFKTLTKAETHIRQYNWHDSTKLQSVIDNHLTIAKQKQLIGIFHDDISTTEQQQQFTNGVCENIDSDRQIGSQEICVRNESPNGRADVDIESESRSSIGDSEARRASLHEIRELVREQGELLQESERTLEATSETLDGLGETLEGLGESIEGTIEGIKRQDEAFNSYEREVNKCIKGLVGIITEGIVADLADETPQIEMTTIDI